MDPVGGKRKQTQGSRGADDGRRPAVPRRVPHHRVRSAPGAAARPALHRRQRPGALARPRRPPARARPDRGDAAPARPRRHRPGGSSRPSPARPPAPGPRTRAVHRGDAPRRPGRPTASSPPAWRSSTASGRPARSALLDPAGRHPARSARPRSTPPAGRFRPVGRRTARPSYGCAGCGSASPAPARSRSPPCSPARAARAGLWPCAWNGTPGTWVCTVLHLL